MTNGDRFKKEIAKKSNNEFVDILFGSMCGYCIYDGGYCGKKSCKDGMKAWFNAPCEENPPAGITSCGSSTGGCPSRG